jgi:RNA polymerase sigma-70 factor (ECF subfamily)
MDATDEQLIDRCMEELPYGTVAYEQLVRRYDPIVFSTCLRYLGNQQEAEEASQDAFLRVFHNLKKFERKSSFRTWLFRIVTNVCATRYQKIKKDRERRQQLHQMQVDRGETETTELPLLGEMHFSGPLGEALEELSESDRQILLLRHVADLSLQEIATTLEISLSASKMRLTRAQQRLKDGFSEAAGNPSEKVD